MHPTPKAFLWTLFLALIATLATSHALKSILIAIRDRQCLNQSCVKQRLKSALYSHNPDVLARHCDTTSLVLARDSSKRIRDRIVLLGEKNSISEYILPLMHLSKYDTTLSSSSFSRQGLSAVKYGYPFFVSSPELRLFLFKARLADVIVLSSSKLAKFVDPATIKYRFRIHPYRSRLMNSEIPRSLGFSEDSEVVTKHIARNKELLDHAPYLCH